MQRYSAGLSWRLAIAVLGVLCCGPLAALADPPCCLTLEGLQRLTPCQLEELFTHATVGQPPIGKHHGKLLCLVDQRLARLRVPLINATWKGKFAEADGAFVNLWTGGLQAIESRYVIAPSWVDGQPAVVIEYAPGTPLFANTRDELREIAPGLYLGPLYDRCPCPKLRGFIALQRQ